MLVLVNQTAFSALQASDIRTHLNITDTSTDAYIQSLIDAAVVYCERITGLDLRPTTWNLVLGQFPIWANYSWGDRYGNYLSLFPYLNEFAIGRDLQRWQEILLPRGPVTAVNSIKYYDVTNALQTLPTSSYNVVLPSYTAGRIEPNIYWQLAYPRPDAVTVSFTSGFSNNSGDVNYIPQTLIHAVKLLVGLWWNQREDINYDPRTVQGNVGMAVDSLLSTFRPALYR